MFSDIRHSLRTIARAKSNRAMTAVLIALASPEYIVQK